MHIKTEKKKNLPARRCKLNYTTHASDNILRTFRIHVKRKTIPLCGIKHELTKGADFKKKKRNGTKQ